MKTIETLKNDIETPPEGSEGSSTRETSNKDTASRFSKVHFCLCLLALLLTIAGTCTSVYSNFVNKCRMVTLKDKNGAIEIEGRCTGCTNVGAYRSEPNEYTGEYYPPLELREDHKTFQVRTFGTHAFVNEADGSCVQYYYPDDVDPEDFDSPSFFGYFNATPIKRAHFLKTGRAARASMVFYIMTWTWAGVAILLLIIRFMRTLAKEETSGCGCLWFFLLGAAVFQALVFVFLAVAKRYCAMYGFEWSLSSDAMITIAAPVLFGVAFLINEYLTGGTGLMVLLIGIVCLASGVGQGGGGSITGPTVNSFENKEARRIENEIKWSTYEG